MDVNDVEFSLLRRRMDQLAVEMTSLRDSMESPAASLDQNNNKVGFQALKLLSWLFLHTIFVNMLTLQICHSFHDA